MTALAIDHDWHSAADLGVGGAPANPRNADLPARAAALVEIDDGELRSRASGENP